MSELVLDGANDGRLLSTKPGAYEAGLRHVVAERDFVRSPTSHRDNISKVNEFQLFWSCRRYTFTVERTHQTTMV